MIAQAWIKSARHFAVLAGLATLAACASAPRPSPVTVGNVAGSSAGTTAASVALSQVGVPYRYGGNTTSGFDCSGLVQYAWGRAGKWMPRTTGQQWSAVKPVTRSSLRAGDLLFFSIEGKMSHVGIYVGDNEFVHAPSTGRTVTVARLDSAYYSSALLKAGRP